MKPLAAFLALAALVAYTAQSTRADANGAQFRGVNLILSANTPTPPETYQTLRNVGANYVALVIQCQVISNALDCSTSPTLAQLRAEMQAARAANLRVILKPHLETSEYAWRGEIPFHPALWHAYRTHVLALANLEPDALVVGTELAQWESQSTAWRNLAMNVRARCNCLITYAANFDSAANIQFWNSLDFIGIDAYFPLDASERANVDELVRAWQPHRRALAQLSRKTGKPILFTEIGYQSRVGAHLSPAQRDPAILDTLAQMFAYQAALEVFEPQAWWRGALWWDWGTDDWRMGFTPNDKPALGVLLAHWRRR